MSTVLRARNLLGVQSGNKSTTLDEKRSSKSVATAITATGVAVGAMGAAGSPRERTFNLDDLYKSGLKSAPTPAAQAATVALSKALPPTEMVEGAAAADLKMAIGLQAAVARTAKDLEKAKSELRLQSSRVVAVEKQLQKTHAALLSERARSAELVQTMELRMSDAAQTESAIRTRLATVEAEAAKATALSSARFADAARSHEAAQQAANLQAKASAEAAETAELKLKKNYESMDEQQKAHSEAIGAYEAQVAELQVKLETQCQMHCITEADRDEARAELAVLAAESEVVPRGSTIGCDACTKAYGEAKEDGDEAEAEADDPKAEMPEDPKVTSDAKESASCHATGSAALSLIVQRAAADRERAMAEAERAKERVSALEQQLEVLSRTRDCMEDAAKMSARPLIVDFPLTEQCHVDAKIHPDAYKSASAGVCVGALGTRFASGITDAFVSPCTSATVGEDAAAAKTQSLVSCVLQDIKSFLLVAQKDIEL